MAYSVIFWKIATLVERFVKSAWWYIEIVWVAGFVMALLFGLFTIDTSEAGGMISADGIIIVVLSMLTLPLGYIVSYPGSFTAFLWGLSGSLFAGFFYLYHTGIESFVFIDESAFDSLFTSNNFLYLRFTIYWGWIFAVGYLQWFILVPRLVSWCRNIIIHLVRERRFIWRYSPAKEEKSKRGRTRT